MNDEKFTYLSIVLSLIRDKTTRTSKDQARERKKKKKSKRELFFSEIRV